MKEALTSGDIIKAANIISDQSLHEKFDCDSLIKNLLKLKKKDPAMHLAQGNPALQTAFINDALENKDAKLASKAIKQFNLEFKDFP